jgi:hypothetical protein
VFVQRLNAIWVNEWLLLKKQARLDETRREDQKKQNDISNEGVNLEVNFYVKHATESTRQ